MSEDVHESDLPDGDVGEKISYILVRAATEKITDSHFPGAWDRLIGDNSHLSQEIINAGRKQARAFYALGVMAGFMSAAAAKDDMAKEAAGNMEGGVN